jgi:tRNA dimethylallyltransferase
LRVVQEPAHVAEERAVDGGARRIGNSDEHMSHGDVRRWSGITVGDEVRGVAIAGPTASGKSALALALAERHGGIVINADSMQVYADLRVLTARPSVEDEARAPHRLYGHVDGAVAYSAAAWAAAARDVIAAVRARGRLPILAGGTGLYFRSLFQGLAAVPPIPPDVRAKWRERAAREPLDVLRAELARRDPRAAARLGDRQRIARALEVIDATGKPLEAWARDGALPLEAPQGWRRIVLDLPRAELHARCDARLDAMIAAGALEEVRALLDRRLDPTLPVMKAIGVTELRAHLDGESDLATALTRMKAATRRYVKRQITWFRTQMGDWERIAG